MKRLRADFEEKPDPWRELTIFLCADADMHTIKATPTCAPTFAQSSTALDKPHPKREAPPTGGGRAGLSFALNKQRAG
jgi:hypothetical protein